MVDQQQTYVDYMTYKIVHFAAMASRTHLTRLKVKWFVNDIG